MEFRFAHVILQKPIILAICGTGYQWEKTEVNYKFNATLNNPPSNIQTYIYYSDTLDNFISELLFCQNIYRVMIPKYRNMIEI